MSEIDEKRGVSPGRRSFLRGLACAATVAAAGVEAGRARAADDTPLDAIMGDGERGEFGQSFDQASRTIHMPKATAPTLSAETAEITQQAIQTYDAIVARGGWPQVPHVGELHLGMRDPGVVDLRSRLSVVRRPRSERRRQRHFRLLCRGRGPTVSGASRPDHQRHGACDDLGGDERAGDDAAGPAKGQYRPV